MKDELGDVINIEVENNLDIIVNMFVWESVEFFKNFMFKMYYVDFFKCKKEWFLFLSEVFYVFWWILKGYILIF